MRIFNQLPSSPGIRDPPLEMCGESEEEDQGGGERAWAGGSRSGQRKRTNRAMWDWGVVGVSSKRESAPSADTTSSGVSCELYHTVVIQFHSG